MFVKNGQSGLNVVYFCNFSTSLMFVCFSPRSCMTARALPRPLDILESAQNTAYLHRTLHICTEYCIHAWNVAYLLISNICVPDEHNGPLILGVSVGRHIFSLRNNQIKDTVSLIFCRNLFFRKYISNLFFEDYSHELWNRS